MCGDRWSHSAEARQSLSEKRRLERGAEGFRRIHRAVNGASALRLVRRSAVAAAFRSATRFSIARQAVRFAGGLFLGRLRPRFCCCLRVQSVGNNIPSPKQRKGRQTPALGFPAFHLAGLTMRWACSAQIGCETRSGVDAKLASDSAIAAELW
jgi:hypothetical protein